MVPSMEAPNPQHAPPRIAREDFEAGRLKPASYSIEDISAAIIDHLERDMPSPRQLRALRRYEYEGSWSISRPENLDDIRKFFEIFDDFFFHGVLKGYCTLEIFRDTHHRLGSKISGYCYTELPGLERDWRYKISRPYPHIAIAVATNKMWPFERISGYMSTLLHEMLHALFTLYTCRCSQGCRQKDDDLEVWGGHHPAWLAAAKAISDRGIMPEYQDGFQDADKLNAEGVFEFGYTCEGPAFSFHGEHAVAVAMQEGVPLPDDDELRRLGLDRNMILEEVKELENRKRSLYWDELRRGKLTMKTNKCIRGQWTVDSLGESQSVKRMEVPQPAWSLKHADVTASEKL
jgi:hypothetical protein